jgi:hypothetical protein
MTKTTKIGTPVSYKNCYIVPVNDGFDVVDKTTGRWIHMASQRLAKWNATVWTRLSTDFDTSNPLSNKKLSKLEVVAVVIDKAIEGEEMKYSIGNGSVVINDPRNDYDLWVNAVAMTRLCLVLEEHANQPHLGPHPYARCACPSGPVI